MTNSPLGGNSSLEDRVAEWVRTRIGAEYMHRRERAMRLIEEAIELAQSEGIDQDMVVRQAEHVFSRPAGDSAQEAGGVAVCLLGWCAATGHTLIGVATAELERIEAKPIDEIRGSLTRKADADLFTCGLPITEVAAPAPSPMGVRALAAESALAEIAAYAEASYWGLRHWLDAHPKLDWLRGDDGPAYPFMRIMQRARSAAGLGGGE